MIIILTILALLGSGQSIISTEANYSAKTAVITSASTEAPYGIIGVINALTPSHAIAQAQYRTQNVYCKNNSYTGACLRTGYPWEHPKERSLHPI